ncbi:hypothetical protein A2011_01290 [candidate division CPR3 bacterium GWE2_35_7]|uniref:Transcriptional regulator, TrmB n=1 Tax=candidate division CPR3 bacterium GW2011_GWF2_35_18 TaxID=1618350 RepID=A0A0G0EPW0_UNCC3|nr:MAG: Transcriptional regulator, TrmB [candidate division CPR3 bacterium GW2011_GWF2_35_18]KKP86943.1 MAG: Transcriptional regulator, TrmB [candidate division CPR3 bacterium GW2011_GWE2_35_7]OGB65833.1 MAG: hypothetical protein A2250_01585 [candidate division CPR3 bacterium RIFOXYA2_FULL_35_13]OGB77240.1 MAG: hypothetical protein A2476_01615 [candidate division CPR3 bacterium RIFOXYC2_FULL_35_7]OGB79194.1 MAG: hypothetical protein A2296_04150 [candidate division CPR3 bacterium RIFOXYB2_FULL_3
MILETLKRFGLSENETKVYLESLKHNETSPFQLSKATGIPRTTVYDVVMELSLKGLIELEQSDGIQKQQTKIRAKNPSILRTILQGKRKELTSLELDILNFLPNLKADFHQNKVNADFQFFPGIEGAKNVYMDKMISELEMPVYAFDLQMPMDIFGREDMNKLVQEEIALREKAKHPIKEVMPLNDWTKHVLTYQYSHNPEYIKAWEMRYIDKPEFILNQRIAIQGDWLRIISAKDNEIWGLKIKSKLLAQSLQSIFLITWDIAKPVTEEVVKSWGENDMYLEEQKRMKS